MRPHRGLPRSQYAGCVLGAVACWSTEARCAIVPPSAGPENFGNKFPGEAAVYMWITHVAIYDAAAAIEGRYRPFLPTPKAPAHTSPAAAIAAATHDTLGGLEPALGLTAGQQAILDSDYAAYLAAIPDGTAKANGLDLGRLIAAAVIAWRANDGRDRNPTVADLNPPPPGPGVWQPDPTRPVLGLRLPGITPLALPGGSQFRPDGPLALTSEAYADDLNQVEQLGAIDSSTRTPEQTEQALFWTDHDLRSGAPTRQSLQPGRTATPTPPPTPPGSRWRRRRTTRSTPRHTPATAPPSFTALDAFFGTDNVPITLDSRATGTTRYYARLHDIVKDVDWARVLVGLGPGW